MFQEAILRSTKLFSTTHLRVVVKNLLHSGLRDIVGVGALIDQAREFLFHHRVAVRVVESHRQAMLAGDFQTKRQALEVGLDSMPQVRSV